MASYRSSSPGGLLQRGSKATGIFTHADILNGNLIRVWLQVDDEAAQSVEDGMAELAQHLNSRNAHVTSFNSRSMYAAKFSDEHWYRCKLVEPVPFAATRMTVLKVFFVDYGNEERVSSSDIRMLPDPGVGSIPEQALPCILTGVAPVGTQFTSHAIDALLKLFINKNVFAQVEGVMAHKYPLVQLFCNQLDASGQPLGLMHQQLIRKGLGQIIKDIQSVVPEYYRFEELPLNEAVPVMVPQVNTALDVFVQRLDRLAATDELNQRMNMAYDANPNIVHPLPSSHFLIGTWCAVRYSLDGLVYRAAIVRVYGQGECNPPADVRVLYVDFGTEEDRLGAELMTIPSEFTTPPVTTVRCQLDTSNFPTLPVLGQNMVQSLTKLTERLSLHVVSSGVYHHDKVIVDLIDSATNTSVLQILQNSICQSGSCDQCAERRHGCGAPSARPRTTRRSLTLYLPTDAPSYL